MNAIPPRAILLIVLGALFDPLYYAYCVYRSGKTAQTHVLTERAERWTLPDGSIQRTRSGLAFKPLALALDPEMSKVQLRFAFHAGEAPGGASGANEYGVSVTFMDTPLVERSLRVELRAGQVTKSALPPRMPRLQRTAHGAGGGPSCRPGLPRAAGAAMGAVGAQAAALLPAARCRGAQHGAAHPVARHRSAAARTQRLLRWPVGGSELRAALWQRVECACPFPLLRDRRGVCRWGGRAGPIL